MVVVEVVIVVEIVVEVVVVEAVVEVEREVDGRVQLLIHYSQLGNFDWISSLLDWTGYKETGSRSNPIQFHHWCENEAGHPRLKIIAKRLSIHEGRLFLTIHCMESENKTPHEVVKLNLTEL